MPHEFPTTIGLALALSVLGCRGAPEQPSAGSNVSTAAELEVAVHGCGLIVEPGVRRCLLDDTQIVSLWVPGTERYELRQDGVAVAAQTLHDPEGTLLRVEIADPSGTLELVRDGREVWSLELSRMSPEYLWLTTPVLIHAYYGDLAGAAALLDAGSAELDPHEAALTHCLAAQLAPDDEQLSAILDELRASPAVGCRGNAHLIAVFTHLYERPDLNAALANLEKARAAAAFDFSVYLNVVYHQADFDLLVGRSDDAILGLDRVIRLAGLVDEQDVLDSAQVLKAIALAQLGRFEEAEQLATSLEAELSEGGDRDAVVIGIRYNLAWAALLRREADPAAMDPTPTLERLAAIYSERGDARQAARTQLHLALAAIQSDDATRSEAALARVDRSMLEPRELVWQELIGARIALRTGKLEHAETLLSRAAAFAQLTEDRELDWLVWMAKATLARAREQPELALAAYERAAQLADTLALAVPGTAGRSLLATSHGRADPEHVELLLELDRLKDALCVAAGSRARHLRTLWARMRPPLDETDQREYQALLGRHEARRKRIDAQLEQAWALSNEELELLRRRLRAEGEEADELLDLATALLERDAPGWSCAQILPREPQHALMTMIADAQRRRWFFFLARGGEQVRVVEVSVEGSAESRARAGLLALEPALAGVERLDVIAIGDFLGVELQRLLFERVSLREVELRHSLGLGQFPIESRRHERRAAVVAGTSDLAEVAREAERVSERLRGHAWQIEQSWSPTSVEQPTLLHYSGHGHHTGLAGWGSYIEVPGFGPVTAAGLVALARAPHLVVLGACSAGRSDVEIIDGGMNLAAAFLLAGAEMVVAPSGPVDDTAALALADDLYRSFAEPEPEALVSALIDRQRLEVEGGIIGPGPRSVLRWRAWVP